MKFWSNFTWNVSFYGNWDNQPPLTFSGSDYGTSTGSAGRSATDSSNGFNTESSGDDEEDFQNS